MLTMDDVGYLLGIIAIICLLLPPKYDPVIKWKEHQEGWYKDWIKNDQIDKD
jgi:hypothetical protein